MKILILSIIGYLASGVLLAQNVGIGTNTPAYPLTVVGNTATHAGVVQKNGPVEIGFFTDAELGNAYLQTFSNHSLDFAVGDGSSKLKIGYPSGYVGINLGTGAPTAQLDIKGTLRIRENGAAAGSLLTSDAAGYATWQAPVAVKLGAGGASNSFTTSKKLFNFDAKYFESQPGLFDLATDAFTAPVAGYYQIYASVYGDASVATSLTMYIDVNGSSQLGATHDITTQGSRTYTVGGLVELKAGDKVSFWLQMGAGSGYFNNSVSTVMHILLVR